MSASQIRWSLDDGVNEFLPIMQSDVMLEKDNTVLIIDAKYYSQIMQNRYESSMDVEAHNLGLTGNEVRDVLNLKLEPGLIEILRPTAGYLPAYHMNKQHWLSLLINELATAQIKDLLDMSYHLTK